MPKTEKEFNEVVAKWMAEDRPETINDAVTRLNEINKLWRDCFGDKRRSDI
jgi:hypothetical protein